MLQIQFLRENRKIVIDKLKIKNFNDDTIIDRLIDLDDQRKSLQGSLDSLLSSINSVSKEIGTLFKTGEVDRANLLKEESKNIKEETKYLQSKMSLIEKEIYDLRIQIPNLPDDLVSLGKSDQDNQIIKEYGEIPDLKDFKKPHWELAKDYNLIDFELGTKITGSGFPVYINHGAKLQRSLISYFLDKNIEAGYREYLPPHLVNKESGFGTGQLPKFEEDLYKGSSENDLFLIQTAEVPITNLFRDMILDVDNLPIKCTAYTPCFRREAGSYGKEVRGLNRLHQFDKVEIVQIEHPDNSENTLDKMISHIETILQELSLPYRIVRLCGGDLGFSASITYDFEVYSAGQDKWLEVSSVSNFSDFQANRLNLRFKKGKNKEFCHTLNGSALALPRIVASLLENNHTRSGIILPKVLHEYTGFDIIN